LIATIKEYMANDKQKPQVFVWSAPVERLLSKIAKCKATLDAVHECLASAMPPINRMEVGGMKKVEMLFLRATPRRLGSQIYIRNE
jgi:hypothetical protein